MAIAVPLLPHFKEYVVFCVGCTVVDPLVGAVPPEEAVEKPVPLQ
jgi:hypothetical protein